MPSSSFFTGRPDSRNPSLKYAGALALCSLLFMYATPAMAGKAEPPPLKSVKALIQSVEAEAEKEIIAARGISKFVLLKQKISQAYPLNKVPMPKGDDECPGITYSDETAGPVRQAEITHQAGAHFATGMEAVLKGLKDIAKWCFARAAALTPRCPMHLSNLAFILNEEGRYQEAILLLNYAREMDPTDSSIYANLGYSYKNLKRYDDAIQAFLTAMALNPRIEKYQQMLLEAQQLKDDQERELVPASAGDPKTIGTKTQHLDQAMALLNKKEQAEEAEKEAEMSAYPEKILPPRHTGGGARTSLVPEHSSGSGPEGIDDMCGHFLPQAAMLRKMGDDWVAGSQEIKSRKNLPSGIREVASKGTLLYSILFYGYASDIYERCGMKDEALEIWEGRRKDYEGLIDFKDLPGNKPELKKKKAGFGIPLCLGPFCFSSGQGKFKMDVSAGILGAEFVGGTKITDWGAKIALGKAKGGLGPFSVEIGTEIYVEFSVEKGLVGAGWDLKAGAGGAFKSAGENILGSKTGVSYNILKTNFENQPKTVKVRAPWGGFQTIKVKE